MDEIWKDIFYVDKRTNEIIDYRGFYQISNFGRVKSLTRIDSRGNKRKERILKTVKDTLGYEYIGLHKNSKQKTFKIHRLVAHMFLVNDNPIEKTEVNHKDENPSNNNIDNLEWCDKKYNINFGTRSEKASKKQSETMKGKYKGEKNPNHRKIVSVDPFTKQPVFTWQYKKQATDFFDISKNTLDCYLKGKAKSGHEYSGFLWYYLSDYE